MMDRRIVLVAAMLLSVLLPGTVAANAITQQSTFDVRVTICNGDQVHLTGPVLLVVTTATSPSGADVASVHYQPQGITGVDLQTGATFLATGVTRDITLSLPSGGGTETFINHFNIQATRGRQSYAVSELLHVTTTPDGIAVSFDNVSVSC